MNAAIGTRKDYLRDKYFCPESLGKYYFLFSDLSLSPVTVIRKVAKLNKVASKSSILKPQKVSKINMKI